ncbi:hypothetical protein L7F22_017450 [Adiantum nelumboides]|nr:hypothetical protein [Adiantum nelumboides]
MEPEKIDALWNCMAFPTAATKADIRSIFVLEYVYRNAQPRVDWYLSRWKERHDVDNTHSAAEMNEEGYGAACDGSWGDIGMDHDTNPSHVEETQGGETPEAEVDCPVQRLHDSLVQVLEEARDDRCSPRSLVVASIDDIITTIGEQQVDLLDSESTQFHEELALLRREIHNLKV